MFVRECVSKRGSRGVRRERIAALLSERADVAIWKKTQKKARPLVFATFCGSYQFRPLSNTPYRRTRRGFEWVQITHSVKGRAAFFREAIFLQLLLTVSWVF